MINADRSKIIFITLFRLTIIITGIVAAWTGDLLNFAFALGTFVLTYLPEFIEERVLRIDLPSEIEIILLLFILASMYFGEIFEFYYVFPWWDIFLHIWSGIIFGTLAFAVILTIHEGKRSSIKSASPLFLAVFSFTFAVTMAVFWEFFEFFFDIIFDGNAQRGSLSDTMWDLIVATVGAVGAALIGYAYLQGNPEIKRLLKPYIKRTKQRK